MKRAVIVSGCVSLATLATLLSLPRQAGAEMQFTLGPPPTAAVAWTSPGTWNEPGFPNATTHVANLSFPLATSLTAVLNSSATIAGLTLGGTTNPVNTTINGSGLLTFQNDDVAYNGGIPLVTSAGAPGATNEIAVSIRLNEQLDFSAASTNNIRVSGVVSALGTTPSIRSFMPAGLSARVDYLDLTDPVDETNYRHFRLNDSAGSPPDMPAVSTQGTLEIGEVFGNGELRIGVTAGQQPVPLGTVILRGPNNSSGFVQLNRANVVLANDLALGLYAVFGGQPNQAVGMNLISNSDSRQVYVEARLSQWFTIKGEHSLTWNNIAVQTNARGWINLLPAGKTFTLNGGQYAMSGSDTDRTFSYDGTGHTVVTGGLHDKYDFAQGGPVADGTGHFRKTGTGTMYVTGTNSTYHGNTVVEAGTLRFNDANHLANSQSIVSTGGAIGVDTGIYSNPDLLARFDAADTGGIMLAASEAALNLDFTSGPLANAANTSVAAPEAGITYTGTITPVGPNYRLGGGTGKLTLPNVNQITGNRGLVVTNGGEVAILAENNYSGPTIVSDYAFNSRTNQAIADVSNTGIATALFAPTTLTVHSLKSGGVDSSIGNSSSDAENLVINGSTLRIVGNDLMTTDRLFTIGARGATIEAVGANRIAFTNSGSLAIEPAGPATLRLLTLHSEMFFSGMEPLIQDATDGGRIGIAKTGPGNWSLLNDNTYSGGTHIRAGLLNIQGNQSGTGETIVEAGAILSGAGAFGGNVTVAGSIQMFGDFGIGGDLSLLPGSETLIGISGSPGSVTVTHFDVANAASLDGTINVRLRGALGVAWVPQLGDELPILSAAGGVTSSFDQIVTSGFPMPQGLKWDVTYGASIVSLSVVAALPGDYNFNGIVDAADYTVWRDTLNEEGTGLAADGNRDGRIDDADFAVWKSHFGETLSGAGASLNDPPAVPEPNCLLLLTLAVCFFPFRKR